MGLEEGRRTLAEVKARGSDEAEEAAAVLGAEIEFFDAGDYPLRTTPEMFDRLVDIYREVKPSFVLSHSLADPYNVDHPEATRLAQEARIVAQAAGHKPRPTSPTARRRCSCSSRTSPSSATSSRTSS